MLNFNMNEFYQLLNMFRKFEKVTIPWIALFTFRTTDPTCSATKTFADFASKSTKVPVDY